MEVSKIEVKGGGGRREGGGEIRVSGSRILEIILRLFPPIPTPWEWNLAYVIQQEGKPHEFAE